jgi:hypothetical protein
MYGNIIIGMLLSISTEMKRDLPAYRKHGILRNEKMLFVVDTFAEYAALEFDFSKPLFTTNRRSTV